MRNLFIKRFAFVGALAFFLCTFFYAYAADGGLYCCAMTNNPNAAWQCTNRLCNCVSNKQMTQEWVKSPGGQYGGPFYDYCCKICLYPLVQPNPD